MYIAGTIKVWVMRSATASRRKSAALKAGMMTSLPAHRTMVVIRALKSGLGIPVDST